MFIISERNLRSNGKKMEVWIFGGKKATLHYEEKIKNNAYEYNAYSCDNYCLLDCLLLYNIKCSNDIRSNKTASTAIRVTGTPSSSLAVISSW